MTVFKCKMCGSPLEVPEGATVVTCDYCRTQQTLPRLDNDRRANLYDRGNHFRRASDYDKAMRIFEQILSDDPDDAEAYWSVVLCRYGVEYVEDPATGRRVPTVNRMQASSILADEDYKQALAHADLIQRGIYERQAKEISAIQEGIAEVVAKEEPFDVFICYKETDAQGQRTRDSVKAHELYNELVREGFRVFFARVTLEDKLGQAYEPYIYSALQSAKAMVVVATKPEYVNAPWVKNEWSRYLALIKAGARKTLIPAYLDMDPYDLPDEFSHLQAQDMSKIGFLQDLVHGLKKICGKGERAAESGVGTAAGGTSQPVVAAGATPSVASLLKRASLFIADGEWERADEYAERVLDLDPTCAEAYLVKVMAELKERDRSKLGEKGWELLDADNFKKAVQFARGNFAGVMEKIAKHAHFQTGCDMVGSDEGHRETDLDVAEWVGELNIKDLGKEGEYWETAAEEFDLAGDYPQAQENADRGRRYAQEIKRRMSECDERVRQAKDAVAKADASREGDCIGVDLLALQAEYARTKESLADIEEWAGVAEVQQTCDAGIAWVVGERVRQAKIALETVNKSRPSGYADHTGSWEKEFERVKESLSDIADRPGVAEVLKECDAGIERAKQTVVDVCVREATEAIQKAHIRLANVKVDVDGTVEAEFKRIRDSLKDIEYWKNVHAVINQCKDGEYQARKTVADAEKKAAFKKRATIAAVVVAVIAAGAATYVLVIHPAMIESQAQGYVSAGDYEQAISLCEDNGLADGADAIRLDWARELESEGDYESAIDLYDQLGQQDDVDSARLAWAQALESSGDHMAAAEQYEKAGKQGDADAARLARAREIEESGDYEEAISLCEDNGLADGADAIRLDWARELESEGDYESAIDLYDQLGQQDDVDSARLAWAQSLESESDYAQASELYEQLGMPEKADSLRLFGSPVHVGDTVKLGEYEQDGQDPIEWIVLGLQDGKALLVSKYALDAKPFNDTDEDTTWETSSLRAWLNEDFWNSAFSEDDQSFVAEGGLSDAEGSGQDGFGESTATDHVFLLSTDEVKEYLPSDSYRICSPTAYAASQGAEVGDGSDACNWWLRSSGGGTRITSYVYSNGQIYSNECTMTLAVRPAIWVNLGLQR